MATDVFQTPWLSTDLMWWWLIAVNVFTLIYLWIGHRRNERRLRQVRRNLRRAHRPTYAPVYRPGKHTRPTDSTPAVSGPQNGAQRVERQEER